MIYDSTNEPDIDYINHTEMWGIVDFLLSGNTSFINGVLSSYINGGTESEIKTRQAKLTNLWLPHYYDSEVTKLNSKIFNSVKIENIDAKRSPSTENFTNTGINIRTFVKKALDSLINYGGVATVLLKINDLYTVKLIEGKHILSLCISELGSVEYIKWKNYETEYDPQDRIILKKVVYYEYAMVDSNVLLYVTKDEETVIIESQFKEIPIVGTQLRINDYIGYRGTPYLASLASNTMRYLLNSMNLDYLLDTVLTPRLIHKGATPIKRISNNNWRGVNIGPQDSLNYLEHSGSSLDSARDQLVRYKEDIGSMLSTVTPDSKQRTAFEIAMLEQSDNTVKDYLVDRYITYLDDLFNLVGFIHPTLKGNNVTYIKPSYTDNQSNNKVETKNNETITGNNQNQA